MSFVIGDAVAAETVATTETPAAALPEQLTVEKMMQDNVLIMAALFSIFYFILIRPQQKRLRKHQDLIKSLTKGQKVATAGGLIGTITKFEGENVVVLEVAQGVKVRVTRSSVSESISGDAAAESANDN